MSKQQTLADYKGRLAFEAAAMARYLDCLIKDESGSVGLAALVDIWARLRAVLVSAEGAEEFGPGADERELWH